MMRGRAGSISSKVQRVFLCCMGWVGILSCLTMPASSQVYGETTPTISSGLDEWKAKVVTGHDQIAKVRYNMRVVARQLKSYGKEPRVKAYSWWFMGDNFKYHRIKLSDKADQEIKVDESSLQTRPGSVWCVTPEYEFCLTEGQNKADQMKVLRTSLQEKDLDYWHRMVLSELNLGIWSATAIMDCPLRSILIDPPDSRHSVIKIKRIDLDSVKFEERPENVLRMTFNAEFDMALPKGDSTLKWVDAIVDLDTANRFRILKARVEMTSSGVSGVQKSGGYWSAWEQELDYVEGFGGDVVPKRVVTRLFESPTRDALFKSKPQETEYLIDKVEFGTVTPADFRGEPYGVPASLIEQDPLPPTAAWWWPWLCGLLGVNALLGLVWWGKRRRESMA